MNLVPAWFSAEYVQLKGNPSAMVRTVLAVAILIASGSAFAQEGAKKIYKCKNEKGEVYYSQSYDPKFCAGGGAQMNSAGIAVKQIDRIKTPEEIAADKVAAAKAAEAKRIEEARIKADNVLLLSYPGEEDLLRAHNNELESVDGVIKTTELSLVSHEKSLAELLAAAADAERAKQPVPEALTARIDGVRKELEAQRALIARKNEEKAGMVAAYEQRLKRFRELKARQDEQLRGKKPKGP